MSELTRTTAHVRSIVFDCADPDRLAGFWAAVLGYEKRMPPSGYETWADYLAARGIPEGQCDGETL